MDKSRVENQGGVARGGQEGSFKRRTKPFRKKKGGNKVERVPKLGKGKSIATELEEGGLRGEKKCTGCHRPRRTPIRFHGWEVGGEKKGCGPEVPD